MLGRVGMVALLVLTLSTGGFFHAVIPHAHGHSHSSGTVDSTWQSLHSALRNEEKKTIFSALSAFTLIVVAVLAVQVSFQFLALVPQLIPIGSPPRLREALRRGNVPYRKFT